MSSSMPGVVTGNRSQRREDNRDASLWSAELSVLLLGVVQTIFKERRVLLVIRV